MRNLDYSLLLIFTVFVSLLFAHPSELQTESQSDVETISQAPIEQPLLTCANVTCPKDAVTCMYTESTTSDLKSIELNSTCTGNNGQVLYSNSEKIPNDLKGYKFLQVSHSVGGNLQTISDFGAVDRLNDLQKEIDDVWSTFRNIFNSTFFHTNLWNPYTRYALGNDRNQTLN